MAADGPGGGRISSGRPHEAGFVMSTHRTVIPLLEADPELGEGLSPAEEEAAARALVAHARTLEAGPWDPHEERWPAEPAIGLLVLDGVLTRDIVFVGRTTTELLGSGDLLRPWDDDVQFEPLPFEVAWHVHEPARVAVLDARFALATARWPALAPPPSPPPPPPPPGGPLPPSDSR